MTEEMVTGEKEPRHSARTCDLHFNVSSSHASHQSGRNSSSPHLRQLEMKNCDQDRWLVWLKLALEDREDADI